MFFSSDRFLLYLWILHTARVAGLPQEQNGSLQQDPASSHTFPSRHRTFSHSATGRRRHRTSVTDGEQHHRTRKPHRPQTSTQPIPSTSTSTTSELPTTTSDSATVASATSASPPAISTTATTSIPSSITSITTTSSSYVPIIVGSDYWLDLPPISGFSWPGAYLSALTVLTVDIPPQPGITLPSGLVFETTTGVTWTAPTASSSSTSTSSLSHSSRSTVTSSISTHHSSTRSSTHHSSTTHISQHSTLRTTTHSTTTTSSTSTSTSTSSSPSSLLETSTSTTSLSQATTTSPPTTTVHLEAFLAQTASTAILQGPIGTNSIIVLAVTIPVGVLIVAGFLLIFCISHRRNRNPFGDQHAYDRAEQDEKSNPGFQSAHQRNESDGPNFAAQQSGPLYPRPDGNPNIYTAISSGQTGAPPATTGPSSATGNVSASSRIAPWLKGRWALGSAKKQPVYPEVAYLYEPPASLVGQNEGINARGVAAATTQRSTTAPTMDTDDEGDSPRPSYESSSSAASGGVLSASAPRNSMHGTFYDPTTSNRPSYESMAELESVPKPAVGLAITSPSKISWTNAFTRSAGYSPAPTAEAAAEDTFVPDAAEDAVRNNSVSTMSNYRTSYSGIGSGGSNGRQSEIGVSPIVTNTRRRSTSIEMSPRVRFLHEGSGEAVMELVAEGIEDAWTPAEDALGAGGPILDRPPLRPTHSGHDLPEVVTLQTLQRPKVPYSEPDPQTGYVTSGTTLVSSGSERFGPSSGESASKSVPSPPESGEVVSQIQGVPGDRPAAAHIRHSSYVGTSPPVTKEAPGWAEGRWRGSTRRSAGM